jgi:hypothetical protein
MNTKKYLIAVIVVFVVYSALAYVIHQVLLQNDYEVIQHVFRSFAELTRLMPLVYLGNLIFALAFCLIYAKGYEPGKNWGGQGLRFGLMVGTLLVPVALTQYVIYPVPGLLALKWILFGYFQVLVTALFAAGIYHFPPPPRTD